MYSSRAMVTPASAPSLPPAPFPLPFRWPPRPNCGKRRPPALPFPSPPLPAPGDGFLPRNFMNPPCVRGRRRRSAPGPEEAAAAVMARRAGAGGGGQGRLAARRDPEARGPKGEGRGVFLPRFGRPSGSCARNGTAEASGDGRAPHENGRRHGSAGSASARQGAVEGSRGRGRGLSPPTRPSPPSPSPPRSRGPPPGPPRRIRFIRPFLPVLGAPGPPWPPSQSPRGGNRFRGSAGPKPAGRGLERDPFLRVAGTGGLRSRGQDFEGGEPPLPGGARGRGRARSVEEVSS